MNRSTTIAPSEKHLEDWIVANHQTLRVDHGWGFSYPLFDRLIARQYPLPSGIADLIVTSKLHDQPYLAILEIKKGEIDSRAIAQVMRYRSDLDHLAEWLTYFPLPEFQWVNDLRFEIDSTRFLDTILVGSSLADEHIASICMACGISVVLYQFNGASYHFSALTHDTQRLDAFCEDRSNILSRVLCEMYADTLIERGFRS